MTRSGVQRGANECAMKWPTSCLRSMQVSFPPLGPTGLTQPQRREKQTIDGDRARLGRSKPGCACAAARQASRVDDVHCAGRFLALYMRSSTGYRVFQRGPLRPLRAQVSTLLNPRGAEATCYSGVRKSISPAGCGRVRQLRVLQLSLFLLPVCSRRLCNLGHKQLGSPW